MELLLLLGLPALALALFDDEDSESDTSPAANDPDPDTASPPTVVDPDPVTPPPLTVIDADYGNHVVGSDGNDNLLVESGFSGQVDAGEGDDRIEATGMRGQEWEVDVTGWAPKLFSAEVLPTAQQLGIPDGSVGSTFLPTEDVIRNLYNSVPPPVATDTVPGVVELLGGWGNDTLVAHGTDLVLDGGPGADLLDMRDASDAFATLGEGDTLIGSDVGPIGAYGLAGSEIRGGDADEYFHGARGATISGGGGDDDIVSYGLDVVITGGEGNDTIYARGDELIDSQTEYSVDYMYYNYGSATLDGGAGDDLILFADLSYTISGGAGADDFTGLISPVAKVVLTDFVSGEDSARLTLTGFIPSKINIVEEDGDTLIRYGEETVVYVLGQTGLSVQQSSLVGETELWGQPLFLTFIKLT